MTFIGMTIAAAIAAVAVSIATLTLMIVLLFALIVIGAYMMIDWLVGKVKDWWN